MVLSKNQEVIKKTFKEEDCNIVIAAGPGCGKSTTLLQLCNEIEFIEKGLMIAFNNAIVKDLNEKIKRKKFFNVKAKTIHSIGLSMLKSNSIYYSLIKDKKFYNLFNSITGEVKESYNGLEKKDQLKVMFAVKDLDQFSRLFLTDDIEEIRKALLISGNVPHRGNIVGHLWKEFIELREEGYKKKIIEIDFTDMIYLPIKLDLSFDEEFEYVLGDEIQDFSELHHRIFNKVISNPKFKKFVGVGDFRQSITGFAGALSNSFELFLKYPNTKELPLDETFRCPSAICKELWYVYPGLKTKKKGGEVWEVGEEHLPSIEPKSLILCRNTAPLVTIMMKLGALGKPCHIRGVNPLSATQGVFRSYRFKKAREGINLVQRELNSLSTRLVNESDRIEYYVKKDALEAMRALVKGLNLHYSCTIDDYLKESKKLFTERPNNIVLSTIHKSKGLEADNVYLLNQKQFMPSKMAVGEDAQIQETNLLWVALSRAKEKLYFMDIKLKEDK